MDSDRTPDLGPLPPAPARGIPAWDAATPACRDALLAAVLVAACGFLYFVNLGRVPFDRKGEPREGALAEAVHISGDWLLPPMGPGAEGYRFPEKPLFFTWVAAASMAAFGHTEFAVRLPSALAATASVLLTFLLGRLLFTRRTAFLAALMQATALNFFSLATKARIDMMLGLFVQAAMLCFLLAWRRSERRVPWHLLAAVCMGVATLCKGPLGAVLPAFLAGVYRLCAGGFRLALLERDRRTAFWLAAAAAALALALRSAGTAAIAAVVLLYLLALRPRGFRLRPLVPIAAACAGALLLAAAWYVPALLRARAVMPPGPFREYAHILLIKENLGMPLRMVQGGGHAHGAAYYIPYFFSNLFPWGLLVLGGAAWGFRATARAERDRFLLPFCWLAAGMVFFSVPAGKRPDYLLPLYPGACLLAGRALDRLMAGAPAGAHRAFAALSAPAWVVFGLLGTFLFLFTSPAFLSLVEAVPGPPPKGDDWDSILALRAAMEGREPLLYALGAFVLVALLIDVFASLRRWWGLAFAASLFIAAAVEFAAGVSFLPVLQGRTTLKPFLAEVARAAPASRLVVFDCFDYAIPFYLRRLPEEIELERGENAAEKLRAGVPPGHSAHVIIRARDLPDAERAFGDRFTPVADSRVERENTRLVLLRVER